MMWFCPDPKCSYSINFLDIPRDVLECLDQTSNTYLKSRKWNINDEEFIELFYDIVERHYFCHLDETGIKVVGFCSGEVDIFDRPILQERHVTEPRQLHVNDHVRRLRQFLLLFKYLNTFSDSLSSSGLNRITTYRLFHIFIFEGVELITG